MARPPAQERTSIRFETKFNTLGYSSSMANSLRVATTSRCPVVSGPSWSHPVNFQAGAKKPNFPEYQSSSLLLSLPDECLLAVLQCAAEDQRCLFSAARGCTRLHQAAAAIRVQLPVVLKHQEQADSVMKYLGTPGGTHHNSLDMSSDGLSLHKLPMCLELIRLQLTNFLLLLKHGLRVDDYDSVLRSGQPLKVLRLAGCKLLDSPEECAAALAELPELQHLSLRDLCFSAYTYDWVLTLHMVVLPHLPHLTHLELAGIGLESPGNTLSVPLPRLAHLELRGNNQLKVAAGVLSAACTCLILCDVVLESEALADTSMLQDLRLEGCSMEGGGEQLLQILNRQQHLTKLYLQDSLAAGAGGNPALEAYAALAASSKLQSLTVYELMLPAGFCQLDWLCPAGRVLPQLQSVSILSMGQPDVFGAAIPEGCGLAGCCPGLQSLDLRCVQCPLELLIQLQDLTRLHNLCLHATVALTEDWVQAVCQLTGLRELALTTADTEGMLLQLAKLQQLSTLHYVGQNIAGGRELHLVDQGGDAVWIQLVNLDAADRAQKMDVDVEGPQQMDVDVEGPHVYMNMMMAE